MRPDRPIEIGIASWMTVGVISASELMYLAMASGRRRPRSSLAVPSVSRWMWIRNRSRRARSATASSDRSEMSRTVSIQSTSGWPSWNSRSRDSRNAVWMIMPVGSSHSRFSRNRPSAPRPNHTRSCTRGTTGDESAAGDGSLSVWVSVFAGSGSQAVSSAWACSAISAICFAWAVDSPTFQARYNSGRSTPGPARPTRCDRRASAHRRRPVDRARR